MKPQELFCVLTSIQDRGKFIEKLRDCRVSPPDLTEDELQQLEQRADDWYMSMM